METNDPGLISRVFQTSFRVAFQRAYPHMLLDADKYLLHVQRVYRLPIQSWKEMHDLDEEIVNPIAKRILWASARMAALEGMGLGLGGFATVLPDIGILSAITLRMLQKLSLIHGFEYSTAEETTALLIAVASAAGVDVTREFIEKQAVEHIVPRIIDRMAVRVGEEAAEKWVGHVFPLLSGGAAAMLNYYFVRSWGLRAQKHFVEKYRLARRGRKAVLLPPNLRLAGPE